MMENRRIDYFDLAKGICIILVVFEHVNYSCFDNPEYLWENARAMFAMPLYFFLSGVFFKTYEGFMGFVKRKINKLLIPFLFFFLVTSCLLPFILQAFGYGLRNENGHGWHTLYAFIWPETFSNEPLWFLLCLFLVNILFYAIHSISFKIAKRPMMCSFLLTMLCGVTGFYLARLQINLPMYIDTTLSAMPFFFMGFSYNHFVIHGKPRNENRKYNVVQIIVLFAVTFYLSRAGRVEYSSNYFGSLSFLTVYIGGLSGTIAVLLVSKILNKLPLISYWGRYSIMILCTHILVMDVVSALIKMFVSNVSVAIFLTTFCVMLCYQIIIPLMKKYMPHVTAQKDLLPIR